MELNTHLLKHRMVEVSEVYPHPSISPKCERIKIMEMGSNNKHSFTYIKELLDG